MTKRTTTGVLLVIGAFVAAACAPDGVLPSGPDLDVELHRGRGRADRVEVCHLGGNGKYKLKRVSERGAERHLERHAGDRPLQADGSCPPRTDKVPVCHNGKTKMVREFTRKYEHHLRHGDELGNCEDTPPPPPPFVCEVTFPTTAFVKDGTLWTVSFSTITTGLVTYTAQWFFMGNWNSGATVDVTGNASESLAVPFFPLTQYRIQAECDEDQGADPQFSGEVTSPLSPF